MPLRNADRRSNPIDRCGCQNKKANARVSLTRFDRIRADRVVESRDRKSEQASKEDCDAGNKDIENKDGGDKDKGNAGSAFADPDRLCIGSGTGD